MKKDVKALKEISAMDIEYLLNICIGEITNVVRKMKSGKAPGFVDIHSDFFAHYGEYTKHYLTKFFTDILRTGNIPPSHKRAKIIAILKPGKSNDKPENYRPMLLSMVYKLLERLLLNRSSQTIFGNVTIEQAGFHPRRSFTDQVLSTTTFIETGFQKKQKVAAAFLVLKAA